MSERALFCCPGYYFTPALSAGKVFGINLLLPCSCTEQLRNYPGKPFLSTLYKQYLFIIEAYLWVMTIFYSVQIFMPDFYCVRVISVYDNYALPASIVFLIISIYAALQFSLIKKKKINLHVMKSSYPEESNLADKLELFLIEYFMVFFFVLLILSVMPTLVFYSVIKKRSGRDSEAFICSFIHTVWLFYIEAHLASIILIFSISGVIASKRFIKLSEELIKIKISSNNLVQELKDVLEKHTELWELYQMINENFKYLFSWIYINNLYATCFFTFGAIFVNMYPGLRLMIGIISLTFSMGILLISWSISYMTSLIYDDFISIGRFYSAHLTPEFKLKIINFMKRFRGLPMGISFADFFFGKKKFVIRVVHALYSIFSSLVQLAGVMQKSKSCISAISTNSSTDNSIIQ